MQESKTRDARVQQQRNCTRETRISIPGGVPDGLQDSGFRSGHHPYP